MPTEQAHCYKGVARQIYDKLDMNFCQHAREHYFSDAPTQLRI